MVHTAEIQSAQEKYKKRAQLFPRQTV